MAKQGGETLTADEKQTGTRKAANFIDGRWDWPDGAEEIRSLNPADTRQVVCVAPNSSAGDVGRAAAAAAQALPGWRRTPAPARGAILARAAGILRQRKQELGELVSLEAGKPLVEGLGDVQEAIDMATFAAAEGRRLYGQTTPSELPDKLCLTFREPVGVCGLITPWNFPIAIPAWKAMAALICGNTLVFKPAEDTPLCGVEFVRALAEAGLPPGVLNLVHGFGESAGEALLAHDGIRLISFTGSTETGRHVAEACGRSGKIVSLECGGKNGQIVLEDADIELAVDGVLWGAFGTAGQRCTSTSRLILHEQVHDRVVARLLERIKSLQLGAGLDPATNVGPLINERQFRRVTGYIDAGTCEGAKLLCGGRRATGPGLEFGWFVEPTVFAGVTRSMRIFREEIFGPVLSVTRVRDAREAVDALNDSVYGLSASVYSRDINQAMAAVRRIETGIVYINGPTIGAEVHLPFGGVKGTGNGHREAGMAGLDVFSEWKTVYIDYSGRLQRAQIDTELRQKNDE